MATTRILSKIQKGGGKLVIFVFVLLIIIQHAYTKYNKYRLQNTPTKVSKELAFNTKNQDRLQKIFSERIDNAKKLLNQKGMTTEKWSELQRKSRKFVVDGMTYYMFIYVKVQIAPTKQTFVCVSHLSEEYEGLEWADIVKSTETSMMFNKYSVDSNLIANMYNDPRQKDGSYPYIKYFWVDPLTNNAVEKQSTFGKWVSSDGSEGIMGIGYTVKNLALAEKSKTYNDDISLEKILFVQIVIGLLGFLTYLAGRDSDVYNVHKALLFMISMSIYVILFTNTQETVNSYDAEIEKLDGILRSLMSVAFMSSVSIYINTKLKKVNQALYIENSCLFAATIMMLLISSLSSTNYRTIGELIQVRVAKQFFFNFAILLNVYIVINFLIHLYSKVKAMYKVK
jgi:hypothetical protein